MAKGVSYMTPGLQGSYMAVQPKLVSTLAVARAARCKAFGSSSSYPVLSTVAAFCVVLLDHVVSASLKPVALMTLCALSCAVVFVAV